jgi:hypothetical protein
MMNEGRRKKADGRGKIAPLKYRINIKIII